MKKRQLFVLFSAIVTVVIAYHMYAVPVPEGFQNPWSLRAFLSPISIFISLSDIGEHFIGGEFKLQFLKFIVKAPYITYIRHFFEDGTLETQETTFDGVQVRIYKPILPASSEPSGGIIFIHGGGWTLCNIDTHDWLTRNLARDLRVVVVSVEYRLAPEFPYPIPLEDSLTAAKYFLKNTARFGVDPSRVAIVGDSAGGNLATSVAMKLRDDNFQPRPKLQVLLYPALQAVDFNTPSYHQERYGIISNWRNLAQFWLSYAQGSLRHLEDVMYSRHISHDIMKNITVSYLNYDNLPSTFIPNNFTAAQSYQSPGTLSTNIPHLEEIVLDPYFSPLLAKDLRNMPKTYIMTVEQDVLRDEGALYAHRLRLAKNDVVYHHLESGVHGLVSFHWFDDARLAFRKVETYIRNNL